jgi:hypothetical protein
MCYNAVPELAFDKFPFKRTHLNEGIGNVTIPNVQAFQPEDYPSCWWTVERCSLVK